MYLLFWNLLLTEINGTQSILQIAGLGLDASAAKLGDIVLFLFPNERDNIVEEVKIKASIFVN